MGKPIRNLVKVAVFLWLQHTSVSGQSGTEVFLSPVGNDATGNGTAAAPYATFSRALMRLGDESGTINFLPGDYTGDVLYIPNRFSAGNAALTVRSTGGKSTVRIRYSGINDFAMGISAANVTLQDLQFHSSSRMILFAELSARNLSIKNCVFNLTSQDEGSVCIRIDGNLAPALDHILIQSNTFIHPNHAILDIAKPVETLHFIGNTAHLPSSAHGIFVKSDGYSGIVVDNNIFHYEDFGYGRTVLLFEGPSVSGQNVG